MKKGFTLVEIMIVVAIIGILIAIAVPGFLRARENSRGQACQENLTKIDGAKEQWALENRLSNGTSCGATDAFLQDTDIFGPNGYVKKEPLCPSGGDYTTNAVGTDPVCSIGTSNDPFIPHTMPE
jgi:prepilin-type N-terminal cleavage/methylation domain-containing protein